MCIILLFIGKTIIFRLYPLARKRFRDKLLMTASVGRTRLAVAHKRVLTWRPPGCVLVVLSFTLSLVSHLKILTPDCFFLSLFLGCFERRVLIFRWGVFENTVRTPSAMITVIGS